MRQPSRVSLAVRTCLLLGTCLVLTGCMSQHPEPPCPNVPRELQVVSLPPYVIEPPDILLVNAVRIIPKPPYRIEPLDALVIQATNTLPPPAEPVQGIYPVDADGTVNLGVTYGKVQVARLTLAEAEQAIRNQLRTRAPNPQVSVAVAQSRGSQMISGIHLVRPDGTIGLGTYGSVYVANMTLAQAKAAIEKQLSEFLAAPEVFLDVFSYNSKYYYLIFDGAGYGQQIIRLPVTGKETVLDAVSQIFGLPLVSSTRNIWVARPNGGDPCHEQILPVDWLAITRGGNPATNYQLMPNDRVYVQSDCLIHANNVLTKVFSPIERIFGVNLLGASTVQSFQQIGVLARSAAGTGANPSILVGR